MASALDLFLKSRAEPATRVNAGTQAFRDGRLFIADPLDMAETPITVATPSGVFPVFVYQRMWARYPSIPKKLTNAILAVEFSAQPPVRWEQVKAETDATGFGVLEFSAEFGSMSIMDGATRARLLAKFDQVKSAYDDFLSAYMEKDGQTVEVFDVPLGDGFNFIACNSGWSNGTYEAFLGRDASGEPVILAVDFGIMDEYVA
ncbi:MAG TPA: DUF4241 domain-containing protein [Hyphomonadaceae bacterium]|jgi:hypothetical protein|nr:DUF4241 domain-containing protein [Hyphomonadaceae bacterium]